MVGVMRSLFSWSLWRVNSVDIQSRAWRRHTWHYLCLTFCGHRANSGNKANDVITEVISISSEDNVCIDNTWDMSDSIFLKGFTYPLPKMQMWNHTLLVNACQVKLPIIQVASCQEFQRPWRHQCIDPWLCLCYSTSLPSFSQVEWPGRQYLLIWLGHYPRGLCLRVRQWGCQSLQASSWWHWRWFGDVTKSVSLSFFITLHVSPCDKTKVLVVPICPLCDCVHSPP